MTADLPLTLPAVIARTVRMTERLTLAQAITLHTTSGAEFQTNTLVVRTVDQDVSVYAVGITGRQRVVQPQVIDPDEQAQLLAALP